MVFTASKRQRAFTLVELSIVLVILGLLVGGVLSGQSLIHAAELRAVGVEKDKYATAVNAFRDKYLALPGDMPNAYDFWGDDCGTNEYNQNTGCNGNGDGNVELLQENQNFWEHLSRAGLVDGTYRATAMDADFPFDLTPENSPASKYPGGYWAFGEARIFEQINSAVSQRPQWLGLGALDTDHNGNLDSLLSRSDAWNLDKKMDDGAASTGSVHGADEDGNSCKDIYDDVNGDGSVMRLSDPYSLTSLGANDTAGQCGLAFTYK